MDNTANIEALLSDFCDGKIDQARVIDERYARLWHEIKRYLLGGGKRLRPRLVVFAYRAYGGTHPDAASIVAAAWELLHACLLVHDDIIDRDHIRHGQPNIAGRYQSIYEDLAGAETEHHALSAALLGGDLLLTSAYELVDTAPIKSDDKLLMHSFIHQALFTVAGGELIDTDSVLYPVFKSNPLSVAAHKTASYSLQLPLQSGAALAGAAKSELDILSRIGLHAGIAFQLQDDLLGVYGDSSVTGKSNRSDIMEKKRTFLVREALEALDAEQSSLLSSLLEPGRIVTASDAEKIVALITASGAKEKTEAVINTKTNEALEGIAKLSISPAHKELFRSLIAALTKRAS